MKVSIVSLSYNKKEMTGNYLSSLYHIYKEEFENEQIELILVDNASIDNAAEYLQNEIRVKKYKNIQVFENKQNFGFAQACNIGEVYAKGKYVLFLNNDSKIDAKGFLEMATFMQEHVNVAIMGGRMKNIDETPQLSAWKFYTLANAILMLCGFQRFGMLQSSPSKISRVDWVTGGCMMVDKAIFDKLGGFDNHFFMYMEDMELCYRAKRAGYSIYYYPYTSIYHIGQGSSNRTFAIINIYKGICYFYKKHMPTWQYAIIRSCLYLKAKLLILFGKISRRSYFSKTYEEALKLF